MSDEAARKRAYQVVAHLITRECADHAWSPEIATELHRIREQMAQAGAVPALETTKESGTANGAGTGV